MGLLHVDGLEFGRYRALQAVCPEVGKMHTMKVAYIDFDGVSLGLSTRFIKSPKVLIHSRLASNIESNRPHFHGRRNIAFSIRSTIDETIFGDEVYDVIIWWNGPRDDKDLDLLLSLKSKCSKLMVFGVQSGTLSKSSLDRINITTFNNIETAYVFVDSINDAPALVDEAPSKKAGEVNDGRDLQKGSDPSGDAQDPTPSVGKSTLSHKDVTVGEMKTEVETLMPTNIKSSSAVVQEQPAPVKKKRGRKPKPKPESDELSVVEVEPGPVVEPEPVVEHEEVKVSESESISREDLITRIVEGNSEKARMEIAFVISGELPSDVEEADQVIKYASMNDLILVS